MALKLGDEAPDFEADTTEGHIHFHEWLGDSWGVLFSHPKDFTPVCTTELGYMAKAKPEFDRRNVKIIGLSVDATSDHERWAQDIAETQGQAPNYPIIGDGDFHVSKLYDMLPASVEGDPTQRTPADNQTVRNVFVIGPDKKIKLILIYPMTTGRNFDEVLRVDRLAAAHGEPQGGHARQLAAGRRRDHRRVGHRTSRRKRSTRMAGRSPSPTSGSFPNRSRALQHAAHRAGRSCRALGAGRGPAPCVGRGTCARRPPAPLVSALDGWPIERGRRQEQNGHDVPHKPPRRATWRRRVLAGAAGLLGAVHKAARRAAAVARGLRAEARAGAALARLGMRGGGAVAHAARRQALVGPAPTLETGQPLAPYDMWGHDALWWLDRMVRSTAPLIERMTLIWHDWFATSNEGVGSQR